MLDVITLIQQLQRDGTLRRVVRNRAAQFGTRARPRLGPELLPEVLRTENSYTDDTVRYRTVLANDGTRYSPVVLKKGVLSGSVEVKLLEADHGTEFTSQDLDALILYLERNQTIPAITALTNWLDQTGVQPLEDLREKHRWTVIELAQMVRVGANNYTETINFPDPAGHRAVAGGAWSNNTYDPMLDVFNRRQLLKSKGFNVSRIITSLNVMNILSLNTIMRSRSGTVVLDASAGIVTMSGSASFSQINAIFQAQGLPAPELYDEVYHTQLGTKRFISEDVMIMVGTTGRDANIDVGQDEAAVMELLPNTLGYYGVGRAAGAASPGRVIYTTYKEDKPPRIEGQLWETSAPVITEPEAIVTIKGIS